MDASRADFVSRRDGLLVLHGRSDEELAYNCTEWQRLCFSALDFVQEPSGGGTVCYSSFYGLDFPTLDGPLYMLGDAFIHANYTVFDFDNVS